MNKTLKYILILIIFILVIIGAVIGYNALINNYSPESNNSSNSDTAVENEGTDKNELNNNLQNATDFEVLDGKGNTVKLSDFFGKPVVINFWATWCGPCRFEMPNFETVYKEEKDNVNFLMINATDGTRDTVDSVKHFIKEKGYTFPVYFDTTQSASYSYNANSIPLSVFINSEGKIVDTHLGPLTEASLKKYIEKIS